jgi:hypothetical protein
MERNDLFVFLVEFGASWNLRVGFIAAEKVAGLQTLSLAIASESLSSQQIHPKGPRALSSVGNHQVGFDKEHWRRSLMILQYSSPA